MIVEIIPAPVIDYDPYEECCVGSHPGATIHIDGPEGITIIVNETRSGIGSTYNISVAYGPNRRNPKRFITEIATVYDDDDCNLIIKSAENPQ
jgi:hypothetical protein